MTEEGREDFDLNVKMMTMDYFAASEGCGWEKGPDEELFAINWRPPTMSEILLSLLDDERSRRAEPPRPN